MYIHDILRAHAYKKLLIRRVFTGEYALSTHIVSGGDDRTVHVWRLADERVQLEHVLTEHIRGGRMNTN